jgi:hypothetical protein
VKFYGTPQDSTFQIKKKFLNLVIIRIIDSNPRHLKKSFILMRSGLIILLLLLPRNTYCDSKVAISTESSNEKEK